MIIRKAHKTALLTGQNAAGQRHLIAHHRPDPTRRSRRSAMSATPEAGAHVRHGEETPRVLAVNRLDDTFSASAALAGRDLFLRGERHLYCLAEE